MFTASFRHIMGNTKRFRFLLANDKSQLIPSLSTYNNSLDTLRSSQLMQVPACFTLCDCWTLFNPYSTKNDAIWLGLTPFTECSKTNIRLRQDSVKNTIRQEWDNTETKQMTKMTLWLKSFTVPSFKHFEPNFASKSAQLMFRGVALLTLLIILI